MMTTMTKSVRPMVGAAGAVAALVMSLSGATAVGSEPSVGDRVPCPAGTSSTVTCTLNPAHGYVMRGTNASETFVGSPRPDKMIGRGGDDVMRGRGGPDLLKGGSGNDVLAGGGGDDWLVGNKGHDRLLGGGGFDTFKGGPGRDRINAKGQRREPINCGGGWDRVKNAAGDRVARNCERVTR